MLTTVTWARAMKYHAPPPSQVGLSGQAWVGGFSLRSHWVVLCAHPHPALSLLFISAMLWTSWQSWCGLLPGTGSLMRADFMEVERPPLLGYCLRYVSSQDPTSAACQVN
jgi:hypothetical protein